MYVKLVGERHYVQPGPTFVGTYRLKAWQFMGYVAHNCVEGCEVFRDETIVSYDQEFRKRLREQRYPEWVQWQPDEEDFQLWETYRTMKHEAETEKRLAELEEELHLNLFQRELDDIDWNELFDE